MSWNRARASNVIEMTHSLAENNLIRSLHHLVLTTQEFVREPKLKVVASFDLIDIFLRQVYTEC